LSSFFILKILFYSVWEKYFMVSRIPLSRQHKSTQALIDSARPFVDHSIEGLRTRKTLEVVYPSSVHNERAIFAVSKQPLASSKALDNWPEDIKGDCLHCGDEIEKKALPIAKYKVEGRFWVFGQFCSPGCSLGYIRESSLGCQVESWTRAMFLTVFGLRGNFSVCPPRFTLVRYGGGMTKESWKPLDFAISVEPPLSTFAMFSEACIRSKGESTSSVMNPVQLKNITRPTERTSEPAEPTSNGREPILLKLLGKELLSPKKSTVIDEKQPPKKKSKKESAQMLLDCV
jgi:hypothetical protein